ncbi:MAG: MATE family efflux transporter [Luteolibacter sp.]
MSVLHESRLTLRLAVPLMIGQLSQMLLGVADTVMVGRLGVIELAALTFANALFFVPFIFGVGLLTSVSVITSNARGAGDAARARASCRHGLFIATALGLLILGISWLISLNLELFGQPPEVAARTPVFFLVIMASVIPGLMSMALKNHADALNRPWPPFWIFLGGVLLNILLNWLMIYGIWVFPEMGFEGAAWATLIARTAILAAMFVWLTHARDMREWVPFHWLRAPDFSEIRRLLAIGFPASLQMICEVGAFSAAGLMMGHFGKTSMAAHQIAITCAGTAFMIPLGLSMSLTVRVGQVLGSGEIPRLRPIVLSGWGLCTLYGVMAASFFLFFGSHVASLFIKPTDAAEVITLGAGLLFIVGIFQLFDSLQVASSAMLRGLQDVRLPALMGFVAYWIIGLPVAGTLSIGMKWGAAGVWWGLAAGLFVASIALGARLWSRHRSAGVHTGSWRKGEKCRVIGDPKSTII